MSYMGRIWFTFPYRLVECVYSDCAIGHRCAFRCAWIENPYTTKLCVNVRYQEP